MEEQTQNIVLCTIIVVIFDNLFSFTFEGMSWFMKYELIDIPGENNTFHTQELHFDGGYRAIFECKTLSKVEDIVEGIPRQQPGTLVAHVLNTGNADICGHLEVKYFYSENNFLRFSRNIPSLLACQLLICIIGALYGIVVYLLSRKKEIKWYAIPVIVMDCVYVMLAMVIRPIGVAIVLREQLGITGSDWSFAFVGYLVIGLLTAVVAPVIAVWYMLVQGVPGYFNNEVGDVELLPYDTTEETTESEIKVSNQTNITMDNVTVFVQGNNK